MSTAAYGAVLEEAVHALALHPAAQLCVALMPCLGEGGGGRE